MTCYPLIIDYFTYVLAVLGLLGLLALPVLPALPALPVLQPASVPLVLVSQPACSRL
jgi:hypothetical protein